MASGNNENLCKYLKEMCMNYQCINELMVCVNNSNIELMWMWWCNGESWLWWQCGWGLMAILKNGSNEAIMSIIVRKQ